MTRIIIDCLLGTWAGGLAGWSLRGIVDRRRHEQQAREVVASVSLQWMLENPNEDDRAAIDWWSTMPAITRQYWIVRHNGSIPDAWAEHQADKGR